MQPNLPLVALVLIAGLAALIIGGTLGATAVLTGTTAVLEVTRHRDPH